MFFILLDKVHGQKANMNAQRQAKKQECHLKLLERIAIN